MMVLTQVPGLTSVETRFVLSEHFFGLLNWNDWNLATKFKKWESNSHCLTPRLSSANAIMLVASKTLDTMEIAK
jgi:hypothetical protein